MSSAYWLIPSALGLCLTCWLIKNELKTYFVFATFSRPELFKYLPYLYHQASRLLIDNPQAYVERHPVKIVRSLESLSTSPDLRLRYKALQAIVDNIRFVVTEDEGAAANALLTVINQSDAGSATHHRALGMRPGIIDSLGASNPMKAVLMAQKGIVVDEDGETIHDQSCMLALKYLNQSFATEPVVAAHAACNIARKTQGQTRDSALWSLLTHMNAVTAMDFESGHAASEQAVLLGTLGSSVHQTASGMWKWHIQRIMADNQADLINKIFYGFGISTASAVNKNDLYEQGFDFLLQHRDVFKGHFEEIVRVSLAIGLRTRQTTRLYPKIVEVWTLALQEFCASNLRGALHAANDAMTFTAPGSQFERQAQRAYHHLRQLEDDIGHTTQMVLGEP